MSRHTYKMFEHRWLFLYRHYTNVMLLCSVATPLAGLMSRYMYLMLRYRNLHLWHRMIHRLQIMARKLKLKILQNKSSRFVLFLAIDYMCVCVCVCVCVGFCGFQLDKKFVNVFCSFLVHFFLLSLFRFFIPRPGRGDHEVVGRVVNQLFFSLPPSPTSSVLPHGGRINDGASSVLPPQGEN